MDNFIKQSPSGRVLFVQHTAAVPPSPTDDRVHGFPVFSEWIDTSGPTSYVLVDDTPGFAVWQSDSGGAGYDQVQLNGVPLPPRHILNVVGTGLVALDLGGKTVLGFDFEVNGVLATNEPLMNFVGVGVSFVDNPGVSANVVIESYSDVQNNGAPTPRESVLDFQDGFQVIDNPGVATDIISTLARSRIKVSSAGQALGPGATNIIWDTIETDLPVQFFPFGPPSATLVIPVAGIYLIIGNISLNNTGGAPSSVLEAHVRQNGAIVSQDFLDGVPVPAAGTVSLNFSVPIVCAATDTITVEITDDQTFNTLGTTETWLAIIRIL